MQPSHGLAFTDEHIAADTFGSFLPQPGVFLQQPAALQRLSQDPKQMLLIDRFGEKVVGSFLECGHCGFDGAIGREHDHRQGRLHRQGGGQQVLAGNFRHAQIADQRIEIGSFQLLQGFFRRTAETAIQIRKLAEDQAGEPDGKVPQLSG